MCCLAHVWNRFSVVKKRDFLIDDDLFFINSSAMGEKTD